MNPIRNNEAGKWRNRTVICVFILLFILLVIQHSFLGLYYDDYGNASLSYGYDSSAIPGTNYTLNDLVNWSKYTYENWGGRILYALMLIPLTKYGPGLYWIVQSFVITLMFASFWFLSRQYKENREAGVSGLVLAILVFFSMAGDISRYGIYWASASVLYLWPVLFFALCALSYEKACAEYELNGKVKEYSWLLMLFLIPMVTLSQEQLGFAFVVWAAGQLILRIVQKKVNKLDIFLVIWSIITYGLFLSAPGNWKRLAVQGEGASASLIERIFQNVPNLLDTLLDKDLIYFNVLFAVTGLAMVFLLKKVKPYFRIACAAVCLAQTVLVLIPGVTVLDHIVFGVFVLAMLFLLLQYYDTPQKKRLIPLWISAVASVGFLLVSPTFPMRVVIPYVCIFTLLEANVAGNFVQSVPYEGLGRKAIAAAAAIALLIPPIYMARLNYLGYRNNDYINQYNDSVLRNYQEGQNHLFLISYGDPHFRAQMPSDIGYADVGYWMKEYYNIPQDVILVWKPLDEYRKLAEEQLVEYRLADGCFDKEGTFFWAQDFANIIVTNFGNTAVEANLFFEVFTGYEELSSVSIYVNDEEIRKMNINNIGAEVMEKITLKPGENVIRIITDAKQIDSGADTRKLHMRINALTISRE